MIKVLDLFSGAGGAALGYIQAGFTLTGIDNVKKPYPAEFIKADVMALSIDYLQQFDLIHASPPCQSYSVTQNLAKAQGKKSNKPQLVEPVRKMLIKSGKPYIIENVIGAPLLNPIMLCGSAFGLKVRRHRIFESNLKLTGTVCKHKEQGRPVGVYGSLNDQIPNGGRTAKTVDEANDAMGTKGFKWRHLCEAIPPAYTHYLAEQIKEQLNKN